ncbi:MAG: hypothetical protein PHP92_05640 [Candidatus Nanoarchaeia archaeon]|jgi:UDPglucose 6-dehydrogenase|nr:hypothetical protein [Candidatus Nanoarchaeia archaeon]
MEILIVGFGVVGKNIAKIFPSADIFDPYINGCMELKKKDYDIAIICVPTPKNEDGSCNFSIVESVIEKHNPKVFHIRSTIPPGTTKMLQEKYSKKCVFSPEYYGGTIHANVLHHNFLTLGCVDGRHGDGVLIANAYKKVFPADFEYVFTDSTSAEVAKYMENCGLAMIVSFVNEFAAICEKTGVEIDEVRELWLKDRRFSRYHTLFYPDQPGWKSICFDKDIPAMIHYAKEKGLQVPILESIMKYQRITD